MASGYKSNGVDFDDLFDPYVSGTKPAATGRRVSGVDLNQRYAPIAYGSKRANVGYRVDGVDVSNLWAAKGTASYAIAGLHGKRIAANDGAHTNEGQVSAAVSVSILSDGTWGVSGNTSEGAASQPTPTGGTWLTMGGTGSDYDAYISISSSGHADRNAYTSAPTWTRLSAAQSAGLSLPPIPAANITQRNATASIRIRIRRRSTGQVVSDTSLTASVSTTGWV